MAKLPSGQIGKGTEGFPSSPPVDFPDRRAAGVSEKAEQGKQGKGEPLEEVVSDQRWERRTP